MGTVGGVVAVAVAIIEGMHLHSSDGFEEGFTHEGGDSLHHSVFVLDVDVDAACRAEYTMSATLDSLVGASSWWTEKSLRLLWSAVWKSLPSGPFSIIIPYL